MRLRFTLEGAAELDAMLVYIGERSPPGSRNVAQRLQDVMQLLLNHPQIGKLTSDRRLRRVATSPNPYLIFYQVTEAEIIVHGVRHSARNPSTMPGH